MSWLQDFALDENNMGWGGPNLLQPAGVDSGQSSLATASQIRRPPAPASSTSDDTEPSENNRVFKRIRTRRACDECRSRKIRCQYPNGREPVGNCEHCDVHGLVCQSGKSEERIITSNSTNTASKSRASKRRKSESYVSSQRRQRSYSGEITRADIIEEEQDEPSDEPSSNIATGQGLEPRYFGVTSIPSILASVTMQPDISFPPGSFHFHSGTQPGSLERGDPDRIHFTSPLSGQHSVLIPPDENEISSYSWNAGAKGSQCSPSARRSKTEERVASHFLSESVLESLVALYRMRIVPVHPVVSISETTSLFAWIRKPNLDSTPPTPLPRILRLIICAVPAQWRAVPKDIRQSLRVTIASQLEDSKVASFLRASSLGNLQTLSVLGMSADLLPSSKHENWLNTGMTIRMGQEIGLHRDLPNDAVPLGQRNRRKRVWAACQIMDAWHAASTGLPPSIDPSDCDVGPPFPYPDHVAESQTSDLEPCFATHVHIWQLSLILRRILKAVCGPRGLTDTSDAVLYELDRDLTEWELSLPNEEEAPSFEIFDSGNTNMIKLLSTCVEGIFVHAFITNNPPIPSHIHFRPGATQWSRLLHRSGDAIEWLSKNGMFYLDTWHIVVHALVICIVLQLHDYMATGNPNRLERLKLANKVVQAWAKPSEGEPARNRGWLATQVKSLVDNIESSRPPVTSQVDMGMFDDLQQAINNSPTIATHQLNHMQQSSQTQINDTSQIDLGQNPPLFDFSEDSLLFDSQAGALDEARIAQILSIFETATSSTNTMT